MNIVFLFAFINRESKLLVPFDALREFIVPISNNVMRLVYDVFAICLHLEHGSFRC